LENSFQKFTKDVIIIGIANILNSLSGIIFLPLITKTLGASGYGTWVQVQTISSLVLGFAGLGLPYALSRFLPAKTSKAEVRDEFWSVFSVVFVMTLVVCIIIKFLTGFIAQAFFDGATNIVEIAILITFVSSLNVVLLSLFRARQQMRQYAFFNVLSTYLQTGIIAYLVLHGYGILSMLIVTLSINILLLLSLFFLIKKQVGIIKPGFSKIREYVNFGLPTIFSNISSWVVYSSDRFVISYFLGASYVGIYSSAYNLGTLPMMISIVLGFIMPATLSKLYDEGKIQEMKTHLSYSLKYSLMLTIPFMFGAAFLAYPILKMFTTPEIASQGQIILIFESINSTLLVSCGIVSSILIVLKKTNVSGIAWLAAAIVNLGLNILMVPHLGILGAAISTLVAYLIAESIQLYFSIREIRIPIEWIFVSKCFLASLVMSLVIWVMRPSSTSETIITVAAGFATYTVSLFILRGFKKEEVQFFWGLIRNRIPASKSIDTKIK
jgi:O-antigen/teichoic acid export membrane protein